MRTVSCPNLDGYAGKYDPSFSVKDWLWGHDSPLAGVKVEPPADLAAEVNWPMVGGAPQTHPAALWIDAVGKHFDVDQRFFLCTGQAEQGLLTIKEPLSAELKVVNRLRPGPRPDVQEPRRAVRTKTGWIIFRGQWRMAAAMGYSIPDPHKTAYFDVEKYLGFARQVYYAGKFVRKHREAWHEGKREVKLYRRCARPEDKVDTLGYPTVLTASADVHVVLVYTPDDREPENRAKIRERWFNEHAV